MTKVSLLVKIYRESGEQNFYFVQLQVYLLRISSPSLSKVGDLLACYHPLKAIATGAKTINGKTVYKFLSDYYLMEYKFSHGHPYPEDRIQYIPCGQCVGCRLEYSRQWANRCMLELQYHDSSYFVTLTYDDYHVPKSYYPDPATGEAMESLTLVKRDFQLFMKRLRKRFSNDHIRFFMAGEYGGETFRPHYHAIIFGLHLDDLQMYRQSPQGFAYYNSPSLQACWSDQDGNPIGFAVVAEVTWETCAYTARYVMKKAKGAEAHFYTDFNIQPEFTLMSRKPGIARQYYDEHPEIYDYDYINISTEKGGRKFRPPRYYDQLYDLEHPEKLAEIKELRQKFAREAQKAKLQRSDLDVDDLLSVQERVKQSQIKSLRRNLV